MSEQKKYVTFRDLKDLSQPKITPPESTPPPASIEPEDEPISLLQTSTPRTTSKTRITSTPRTTSKTRISSITSTPRIKLDEVIEKETSNQVKEPIAKKNISVAPERDFQRVPNSVTRQALPNGLFKGKSKQVWDYLWSVSRGAINPVRIIKKSRREIKVGTGIGSMVTVDAAITHLAEIGLLQVLPSIGSLSGNAYEIFTPEEIGVSSPSISSISSTTSPTQKVDILDIPESSISSTTLSSLESIISKDSKTSFKTITDDDDTHTLFKEFNEVLLEVTKKILGERVQINDQEKEKWKECATIIATELESAASKTTSVSSVPAFLAAHLRRVFSKSPQKSGKSPETSQSFNSVNTEKKIQAPEISTGGTSKYTLSECLQYAESLERKGIYNPGGYATTIYRTAEADDLVGEFLRTKNAKTVFTECPDCEGRGVYYPDNSNQSAINCEHPKLPAVKFIREAIQEIKLLHKDDSSYETGDLLEDLKFRCEREGQIWDEHLALKMIQS